MTGDGHRRPAPGTRVDTPAPAESAADAGTASRLPFQTRLVLLLVLSVCLVQALTLGVVQLVTERSVRNQLEEQLRVGARVWERFDRDNDQRLIESLVVLADDFGFRAAVASGDPATMGSALGNHGGRLDADFGALLRPDGSIAASLAPGPPERLADSLAPLLARARSEGFAVATLVAEGGLYRVGLVPVLAPTPIAWLAMGDRLDAAHAAQFQALTGLQASFVALRPQGVDVFASSLPGDLRSALDGMQDQAFEPDEVVRVGFGSGPWYVLAEPLAGADAGGPPLAVLLQTSLDAAMAPYAPIRLRILALTVLVTLLALAAATWLGRGLARPLSRLAWAAERVGQGDYSGELPVAGRDEVARLGRAFARMREDIAEREARIVHQATHDALTGLPNRSRAIPEIEAAMARLAGTDRSCAVLLLDLDRFKEINDTLGHAFGDQVLAEAAKRLRASVRERDLVLRLGGDEFLLLFEDVAPDHVQARARGVLQALREPLQLPRTTINLDASLGVVLCPQHGTDAESLLRRADIALYDAKQHHLGVALYRSGREEVHLRQLRLIGDLRHAAERGELRVEYQPKIDLASGRVVHAEALLRWTHPELGVIAPDEFVPLAEHSGIVHALTQFVLESALAENARWRAGGLDLGIAVNLSALDLLDAALPEFLERALREHRVPAGRLILEVTESALMRDVEYAVRVLQRLHGAGVRLSIDDFGTGHSSLAQLKRLPVDELKIDKSFVMRLASGSDDDVIVRSTIELGHNMGLTVIAEGVENEEGLALLRSYRCDMAQGFWFSRPMPGPDLPGWCAQYAGRAQGGAGAGTAP
jgi:diguanylate cyclase (GGDEF)-like protein